jgi:hypothetical protein
MVKKEGGVTSAPVGWGIISPIRLREHEASPNEKEGDSLEIDL